MKNSWQRKKLGEVCDVIAGQSPEGEFYNEQGNGLPFYQGKKEFTEKFIGAPRVWTTKITKESGEGDILMSVRAPVGPTNFSTEKICIGRGLAAIRAKENTDRYFIFYFLRKFENEIVGNTGAVFDSISKTQIENIELLVPSLPEQKRIVKVLDEVFEEVGKAKENAEKNLRNSRELFESYLQSVFENPGKDWEKKTLKEITSHLGDGLHGTPKYTEDGEYYFINGNNLDKGEIIFKENTKRVSVDQFNKYKKKLNDRTILVSINGTLCNVAFYNNEKVILGKSACYFNLLEGIDKNFIKYIILSPYFIKYAFKEATGATIKNVSLKTMREFVIYLPKLQEQKAIVKKLDALSEETKKLEEIYKKEIADLEELKKSVLQKAFRGEL